MERFRTEWKMKIALIVALVIAVFMSVYPSLSGLDPATSKFPVKKKVNLGLDLQGGVYMVFGVDIAKVFAEMIHKRVVVIQEAARKEGINTKMLVEAKDADGKTVVQLESGDGAKLAEMFQQQFPEALAVRKGNEFEISISSLSRAEIEKQTLDLSIQVIRNRIDEFGVSEPSIVSQGNDRIVVELPGIKDIERAKNLVGRTAKLEFKIVDDQTFKGEGLQQLVAQLEQENKIAYKEGDKFSAYVEALNTAAKGKIDNDKMIAFERPKGQGGQFIEGAHIPYLLSRNADVSGSDLANAQVTMGEYGAPVVSFQLNPEGATKFGKLTGENIQKRLAIVLDGVVQSAPNIQSQITDNGQITLGSGGNFETVMAEAKDLSVVLRAGALPADLKLQEQRVIGPSLGADSIKSGVNAGLIGCLVVFVFMMFYYRFSGVIAVVSLLLNVSLVFAGLIWIDATLTLPGIAGLALTIGMAVDSNVIIFERIRDELREKASVKQAVERGFDRAFACIFDANITHGIVAIMLFSFGTGPIKGFAVTLLIGIFTTLLCAVTVAKLCFDLYLYVKRNQNMQTLSI
jgi:preprotein translocase subunit SecD